MYFGSANFSSDAFVSVKPYVNYVDETVYFTNDASVVNSFMTKFDDAWVDTSSYANYANVSGALVRHYPTMAIDPELNFPPGQDYANRSVSRYNAETRQIDAMMFRITDQRHTNAIIAAKKRGVAIRLIVDPGEYRNRDRIWDAWNVDRLYAAGIPIRITTHQGENHGKLVMLHGLGLTIFGSSNWSSASANSQHEHNYFTTKPNIFQWFTTYFDRRWNNSNPAGAKETAPFTPIAPGTPTYHTPANGASNIPITGASLVWDGGAWAHNYDVYFGTSSNPPLYLANQNLGPDDPSKSPKQYQSVPLPTLVSGTTYFWRIVSKTMANVAKTRTDLELHRRQRTRRTTESVGTERRRIGADPRICAVLNGSFSITGSGADIWGTTDAFHFVYQQLTGNFTIQARVASVREASTWSKAGVMIRETLSSHSKHAMALVSAAKGVALQWRATTGGTSQNKAGSSSAAPRWVRLQRSGRHAHGVGVGERIDMDGDRSGLDHDGVHGVCGACGHQPHVELDNDRRHRSRHAVAGATTAKARRKTGICPSRHVSISLPTRSHGGTMQGSRLCKGDRNDESEERGTRRPSHGDAAADDGQCGTGDRLVQEGARRRRSRARARAGRQRSCTPRSRIGDSLIMMNDAMGGGKGLKAFGGSPASLWIYVEDCDALFNRAVAAGAKVAPGPMGQLTDQFWGDRTGTFTDPSGYQWTSRRTRKISRRRR